MNNHLKIHFFFFRNSHSTVNEFENTLAKDFLNDPSGNNNSIIDFSTLCRIF